MPAVRVSHVTLPVSASSYLTYIKLWTVVKRNESMARVLQAKLKEPQPDESKRGPRPQDLIRLYDIILQVSAALEKCESKACLHFCTPSTQLSSLALSRPRAWRSCPSSWAWRMITASRRRWPSRLWSTRHTGTQAQHSQY